MFVAYPQLWPPKNRGRLSKSRPEDLGCVPSSLKKALMSDMKRPLRFCELFKLPDGSKSRISLLHRKLTWTLERSEVTPMFSQA